jgi:hypothetical protein
MVRARPLSGTRPQRLSSAVHRHGDEHEAGARADARDLTPDPIEIVEAAHCRSSRSLSAATAGFATAFLRPYGEIRPTLQEALIAFRRTRRRDCRRREGAPVSNDLDSFVCLTHILSLECKYPFREKVVMRQALTVSDSELSKVSVGAASSLTLRPPCVAE